MNCIEEEGVLPGSSERKREKEGCHQALAHAGLT